MPPRRSNHLIEQQVESLPPQAAVAPPPAPVDPINAFYEMFRTLPNFCQDPLTNLQA